MVEELLSELGFGGQKKSVPETRQPALAGLGTEVRPFQLSHLSDMREAIQIMIDVSATTKTTYFSIPDGPNIAVNKLQLEVKIIFTQPNQIRDTRVGLIQTLFKQSGYEVDSEFKW